MDSFFLADDHFSGKQNIDLWFGLSTQEVSWASLFKEPTPGFFPLWLAFGRGVEESREPRQSRPEFASLHVPIRPESRAQPPVARVPELWGGGEATCQV